MFVWTKHRPVAPKQGGSFNFKLDSAKRKNKKMNHKHNSPNLITLVTCRAASLLPKLRSTPSHGAKESAAFLQKTGNLRDQISPSVSKAPFTQDAEHLVTGVSKLRNTLWSMGVFTQVVSNIKGFARKFARKSAYASCVNGVLERSATTNTENTYQP